MEAKELRIGNWVYTLGANVRITPYGLTAIYEGHPQSFDPIHLTPEILEKAGFKYKTGWVANGGELEVEQYVNGKFDAKVSSIGKIELSWRDKDLDHVEYLHQLQNIYYSLEGKELQINLG